MKIGLNGAIVMDPVLPRSQPQREQFLGHREGGEGDQTEIDGLPAQRRSLAHPLDC